MPVPGLVALFGALAAACLVALWLRRVPRRLRSAPSPSPRASDVELLATSELGAELGERATLVQFSTAFCQPCRATRRILDDVARAVPGVAHIEVDAESHLELVRRLDIRRTPTVLVLDEAGRVVRRASGQPRKVDVLQALDAAVS
jgi:thiol-disulfide isomerase/thioredoxin